MRCVLLSAVILLVSAMAQAGDRPSTPSLKLKAGDHAPDFTLTDQNGRNVSLHEYRGRKSVVLAFYVFAFTGG
jgi:cytochrome oxidase Cu insertion factor (SCO1/SenC/PrrC family)